MAKNVFESLPMDAGKQLEFSIQTVVVNRVKAWRRRRYERQMSVPVTTFSKGYKIVRKPDEPCANIRVWSPQARKFWTVQLRNEETDAERGDELKLLYARSKKKGQWRLVAIQNSVTASVTRLDAEGLYHDIPDSDLSALHTVGATAVGAAVVLCVGINLMELDGWVVPLTCGAIAGVVKSFFVRRDVNRQVAMAIIRLTGGCKPAIV